MLRIRTTSFDTAAVRIALGRATRVVIDLETTGVLRTDQIVAVGILVDRDAHILMTENHRDISSLQYRVGIDDLRHALEPLATRHDLIAIFHNAIFDLGMLERAGIPVRCLVHDTMKMLKLIDNDRGPEADDAGTGIKVPRFERRFKESMNYKLKDVARMQLGINAMDFPGRMTILPMPTLVKYLKSDLLITRELYEHVSKRMKAIDHTYNRELIAPLTPMLTAITLGGVQADRGFIESEGERLVELMKRISDTHDRKYGQKLDVGDFALRGWIYFKGLRCPKRYSGKKRLLSLKQKTFRDLLRESTSPMTRESLALIHDYKVVQSVMTRLMGLTKYIDRQTDRIFTSLNDFQTSGRVSSTYPNLQQIAREVAIGQKKELISDDFKAERIKSRNAIRATDGFTLVAFDIAQSDIRILAHSVESFAVRGRDQLEHLLRQRERRLRKRIAKYRLKMWDHFQPQNRKAVKTPLPEFDPAKGCELADDFRDGSADFYTVATERMLGRKPQAGTSEREHMKQTILGIVNGMGTGSLAERLLASSDAAKGYVEAFNAAYKQVAAFADVMKHAFAITGEAFSFGGRRRRVTPHWWMVSKPVLDIFVSYRGADKLWMRVVPLRPNRHTLCCWVLKIIDAEYGSKNEGLEIYNHKVGRISQAPYRVFNDGHMVFKLPVRNVSWRLIRRVRTSREEVRYEGFDRTSRQLFNHICQAGTADLAKTMMLRAAPVCDEYGARTILQIHDEIVFEVPTPAAMRFSRAMKQILELPPSPAFRVPIVVEPKMGTRFGELRKLSSQEVSPRWWVRAWFHFKRWLAKQRKRLRF